MRYTERLYKLYCTFQHSKSVSDIGAGDACSLPWQDQTKLTISLAGLSPPSLNLVNESKIAHTHKHRIFLSCKDSCTVIWEYFIISTGHLVEGRASRKHCPFSALLRGVIHFCNSRRLLLYKKRKLCLAFYKSNQIKSYSPFSSTRYTMFENRAVGFH